MPTAFFNGNAVFKPHIEMWAAMFFMPNGIFNLGFFFKPHTEMWGYHALSCLTAF